VEPECGHINYDLEPDEDGDLVCEQCGTIIPEDDGAASTGGDEKYECPDCGHITVNPEPDDEGDRICEECGCILPEKLRCECEKCGHENVDPVSNKNGEYICAQCGEPLDIAVSFERDAPRIGHGKTDPNLSSVRHRRQSKH
jgi:transcription initiation factor TFIIIB Brf1 subunit/transcription initiation factor TFIIB